MRYEGEKGNLLERAKAEAARKMAEIVAMLAPGSGIVDGPDELARLLGLRMAALGPAEREALKRKMAVALADLEEVNVVLNEHLDNIRRELRAINGHGSAAQAYERSSAPGRRPGY